MKPILKYTANKTGQLQNDQYTWANNKALNDRQRIVIFVI